MRRPLALAAALGATTACAPALRALPPAEAVPADPAALASEVHVLAREIERSADGPRRTGLAERAVAAGLRCEQAAPSSPGCDYALAIALGMLVRERPATAHDGLARMTSLLRHAAASEPSLDHRGPDRVLALLLLRAPGWPLGPGDAEEALAAARRAVGGSPEWAPNQLALAEALDRNGDAAGGRTAAERALRLAEVAAAQGHPDAAEWGRQARAMLAPP